MIKKRHLKFACGFLDLLNESKISIYDLYFDFVKETW